MKTLIALTLALLLAAPAFGASHIVRPADEPPILSWEAPTTRMDGTPITAAELASYRIYWWIDTTDFDRAVDDYDMEVSGDMDEVVASLNLPSRLQPYDVTFGIRAVDTNGLISPMSELLQVEVTVLSLPGAPTQLRLIFGQ